MDDFMMAVRKLLIEHQGVKAAKVRPEARLLHDLGIDGDDAAELFAKLHRYFGTDFAELERQWPEFFNSESASPRETLVGILVVILCGGLSGMLVAALHWPKPMAFAVALVLLIVGYRLFSQWAGKELRPVTVGGLVEIVKTGRWPIDPGSVR